MWGIMTFLCSSDASYIIRKNIVVAHFSPKLWSRRVENGAMVHGGKLGAWWGNMEVGSLRVQGHIGKLAWEMRRKARCLKLFIWKYTYLETFNLDSSYLANEYGPYSWSRSLIPGLVPSFITVSFPSSNFYLSFPSFSPLPWNWKLGCFPSVPPDGPSLSSLVYVLGGWTVGTASIGFLDFWLLVRFGQ